jgi:hypothetical protein
VSLARSAIGRSAAADWGCRRHRVVGAFGKNSPTVVGAYAKNMGYVFVPSGSGPDPAGQAHRLRRGNFFGLAAAASGSTAVVGAENKNLGTGAACAFVLP